MSGFITGMPLRVRLVAASTLLVVLGLVISGLVAASTLRGYLVQRVDEQLSEASSRFSGPGFGGPPGDADNGAGFDRGGPSPFYAAFLSADGTVESVRVPELGPARSAPQVPHLTGAQVHARDGRPFTVAAATGAGQWRAVAVPEASGSGRVVV
ncbi:MAG: two-component system, OmpR family, sensor kinase, partial [Frankiaceae bacterium]|nr:two-component system, OmpR family, sensor kinase [Frankiaceae bacterium]